MKTNAQKAHNITRRRKGKVVKREGGVRPDSNAQYFAPDLKWLELVLKLGKSEGRRRKKRREISRFQIQFTLTAKCNVLGRV